jgi:hypothetical protein
MGVIEEKTNGTQPVSNGSQQSGFSFVDSSETKANNVDSSANLFGNMQISSGQPVSEIKSTPAPSRGFLDELDLIQPQQVTTNNNNTFTNNTNNTNQQFQQQKSMSASPMTNALPSGHVPAKLGVLDDPLEFLTQPNSAPKKDPLMSLLATTGLQQQPIQNQPVFNQQYYQQQQGMQNMQNMQGQQQFGYQQAGYQQQGMMMRPGQAQTSIPPQFIDFRVKAASPLKPTFDMPQGQSGNNLNRPVQPQFPSNVVLNQGQSASSSFNFISTEQTKKNDSFGFVSDLMKT